MEFDKIKKLIKLIQRSKISEFEYEDEVSKISIRTNDYQAPREVVVQPSLMPNLSMPAMVPQQAALSAQQTAVTPAAAPDAADSAPAKEESNNYVEIAAPMVGTFYRAPSPEKPAFVKVGDTISVGDKVCLIEAMKLFNEVTSEVEGRIVKVMVEDASPVEYGQVLFLVEPV